MIHGFDDAEIIAGQGTAAVEILDDVPDADAIVVPTGGAGLLAGVAIAAKARRPDIKIIAVEAAAAASFHRVTRSRKTCGCACSTNTR